MINIKWRLSGALACFFVLVSAAIPVAAGDSLNQVSRILHQDSRYSLFVKALDVSHAWEDLSKMGKAIILVPENQAMEREGSYVLLQSVYMTKENTGRLKNLVSFHIIPEMSLSDLATSAGNSIRTLSGDCLSISSLEKNLLIGPEKKSATVVHDGKYSIVSSDSLLIQDYRSNNCND